MNEERQRLEKDFHDLLEEKRKLIKKINSLWKKLDNEEVYTDKMNDEHSKMLSQKYDLDKKISANVKERSKKGFIKVEL